ncbi:MAG: gliding motility-associated ABC transporter ATP-binding subunit GldA [Bacteroidetes bacterium]|nr:MAG: gliding motility-associated ABC transporter ATP-binding subunit GldA [Bacteroidota bacterium]
MSISIQNISKEYGSQKALDQVSFEIKEGEIVGLLGPNGAGKSTLMKILSGFIPPTDGEAKVEGLDVMEESLAVREKIGYLPESNPLYLDMYVKEYLQFVGGIYKVKNLKHRIAEMIELTGLQVEQHKKLGALSKGYRQRVGLAATFIHDPKVLILDEPTSGLDPNQLVEIRNLIKEIGKNKTVLFSSHIMQEVEAICDRVIIINKGKMVADSPTSKLQNLLKGGEIISVEFQENVDLAQLKKIDGVEDLSRDGKIIKIRPSQGADIRAAIYDFARDNQLTLIGLKSEEMGLEDIFRELTLK